MNICSLKDSSKFGEIQTLTNAELLSVGEVARPSGYAINFMTNIHAIVRSNGVVAEGWGSGSIFIAREKAISEAIERLAFFLTKGGKHRSRSTNGWAAHFDEDSALKNALFEIVERDTALKTWFSRGPYFKVPSAMWPEGIKDWTLRSDSLEYGTLNVWLSIGKNGPCITVMLKRRNKYAVVGHACNESLQDAIISAFNEALRSAHSALRLESFAEIARLHGGADVGVSPNLNALAYAYQEPLPALDYREANDGDISRLWTMGISRMQRLIAQLDVERFKINDRIVVKVTAPEMAEMFWGKTPGHISAENRMPHFVG